MVILTRGDERGLLAALSLDDKVRLLTGADNWRTCPLPAIGLRAMVVSDGPAGVRGVTMDERNPSSSLPCPSALGATWDPGLVQALAAALGAAARSKGVDLLMTGYNKVNGITMTENGPLLGRILKDEWGFEGVALSDWHAARSTVETAVAGLDLAMPGPDGPWGAKLAAAVRSGEVGED